MDAERSIRADSIKGSYEKLKSVVRCFKTDELKVAKNYVQFGHMTEFKGQTLELFEYILKNPNSTHAEAQRRFELSKKAFGEAVFRLKEKLCYCLSSEFNTQKDDAYSETFKAYFEAKDLLKQYQILLSRGAQKEALDRLEHIIMRCEKYEWYHDLIEAYYYKLKYLRVRSSSIEFTKIEERITYYEHCRNAYHRAKSLLDEIEASLASQSKKDELIPYIKKCMEMLTSLYDTTNSNNVLYCKTIVELRLHEINEDYRASENTAHNLFNLVTTSPVLNTPNYIGLAYAYRAEALINMQQFEQALVFIMLARKQFKVNSKNYAMTLELEYFATFYSKDYKRAETCMSTLLDNPNYPVDQFMKNRRLYLLACVSFAQGNYEEARERISQIYLLTKDKAGWNIGIRMMNLLLDCLQPDFYIMHVRQAAFMKDLGRTKKIKSIRKRDLAILDIIKDLSKRYGDFNLVFEHQKKAFALLETDNSDYRWKPCTHEMIPFELWFKERLKHVKTTSSGLHVVK